MLYIIMLLILLNKKEIIDSVILLGPSHKDIKN